MIQILKISKWLYINPLTILLFIFCFITRKLDVLLITYSIMFVHELSHLIAALCIGLVPSYIAFHPFGVNLKLKNKIVYSLADEIILYMAGPFCNILMSLISILIYIKFKNVLVYDFYIKNIALFTINMLPIVPLDGGIVLKKIIIHKIGYKKAENIMIFISSIFIIFLCGLGIYTLIKSDFNFSILFLVVFMIGNIFTQKEKYNIDFVKEMMFYKEKSKSYDKQNVKILTANNNCNLRLLAKNFNIQNFFIIFMLKNNGEISDIVTETQIMDKLTK